jgi:hypothetical protein
VRFERLLHSTFGFGRLLLLLTMAESLLVSASAQGLDPVRRAGRVDSGASDEPDEPPLPVKLEDRNVIESSGLAASNRRPHHFWTHNDSGGRSIIYAFDAAGKPTGFCRLRSVRSQDWEDMASFRDAGIPRLLIADCGDNKANRPSISLYLIDEPDPEGNTEAQKVQTISVRYPDGARDCEAVAVDTLGRQIVLVAKSLLPTAGIYVVPLPERSEGVESEISVTAMRIGTLPVPMVTGMDIDPANGDIWIVNYFQAFCFSCTDRNPSIAQRLSGTPSAHEVPRWKQIEAVAVANASTVWVTTEGSPALLGRIRITAETNRP